jgi:hypothetical protein
MVMNSIDDPNKTSKKPAGPTEPGPTTSEPERASPPGEDAPNTEPPEPPHIAPLALRSDGKTLLSVSHLQGVDLAGREPWTAVVLTDEEAHRILDRLSDAFDEIAGYAAGHLLWNAKKRERGGSEGGSHG